MKFVSGNMWLEKIPKFEFPKYLNKSRCAKGVKIRNELATVPFKTTPTIAIIELKNTDRVLDLQIKDKVIAKEM